MTPARCSACGQPLPPRTVRGTLVAILTSRKVWVLAGSVGAAIAARAGLPEDLGREVAGLLLLAGLGYTGAQAVEDAAQKRGQV